MSVVQVQVMDQDRLDKLQALLAGIPNGAERAARSAMQRAASHLRTNSAKPAISRSMKKRLWKARSMTLPPPRTLSPRTVHSATRQVK